MTDVLARGHGTAPSSNEDKDGEKFSLDEQTKQLLRLLVGDGRSPAGEPSRPVDWDSIWSLAENGSSQEAALGSAVLAAEEALVGERPTTPSALLARTRHDVGRTASPSEILVGPGRDERDPLTALPPARTAVAHPELSKKLRAAVAGATWVRNVGIIVVLFAVWQLWGTGIAEAHAQHHLKAEYALLVSAQASGRLSSGDQATVAPSGTANPRTPVAATTAEKTAIAAVRGAKARALSGSGQAQSGTTGAASYAQTRAFVEGALPGGVLGRIRIPAAGVDRYFVEGVGEAQLQQGPGRYPGSGLPGQPGNLAIAGHRTTYGAPFFELDHVRVGDDVIIDVPQGRAIYVVSQPPFAVSPYDTNVLDDFGDSRLTLTTCNPPFFATTRLIVIAELSEWLPTGARIPVTSAGTDPAHMSRSAPKSSTRPLVFGARAPDPAHDETPSPRTGVVRAPLSAPMSSADAAVAGTVPTATSTSGTVGTGRQRAKGASGIRQGLADDGSGWHFGEIPIVLAVLIVLAILGALYGRVAKIFVGGPRWMVMVPMWAAGLLALFKVLGLLLPADL